MIRILLKKSYLLILSIGISTKVFTQTPGNSLETGYKTVSAGPQYEKSTFYQWFWGRNYRKEWTEQVKLPIIILDTLKGGLISYKEGGSNQSKSLHLKLKGGKEYALRSVDKSLDKVIPKIFYNTFLFDIVNDEISMSNPYGALAVPKLAEAIGMPHTLPQYFYLPEQKALDTLNKKYAGKVYLLEQRPKGDWSNADNLGNFKEFEDTEEMLPNILKDSKYSVDQPAFARARLLDMMIGDFDRHADQWKWGIKKDGDQVIYVPVPTDRDQAYSTHNGVLLNLVILMTGMQFLKEYDYDIKNVKGLATINRVLDRLVTNKMTAVEWENIAVNMQEQLTDSILSSAVRAMPPEIFAIRGEELIAKLKSRRGHLVEWAKEYYSLLAEESEIVGTAKDEYIEINHLTDLTTEVKVFKIGKNRLKDASPYYSRIFKQKETDEIRIYGLAGNDIYKITGELDKKINLRIIGGTDKDTIIDETARNVKTQYHVYDDADNYFPNNSNAKLHISKDSAVHSYNYNSFLPDKKGIVPHLPYNDADRIFIGLRYQFLNQRWRKKPFAYRQSFDVDYSISQKAMSTSYNGLFPQLFGKWDLVTKANYDWVRWINFYGLGNETANITNQIDFYRMRSEEGSANLGLGRSKGKSKFLVAGFYQRVRILSDTARFVYKNLIGNTPGLLVPDNYAGLQIAFDFADVKDSVLPQKGITLSLHAKHTQNLNAEDGSFQTYSASAQFFIPLVPRLSLAIKGGAATLRGTPRFYQYPYIGESYDLRGFRRERFSGRSTAYSNTELRYIKKVRSYFFNGKAGLMAFVDNGRVWMPGEKSNKIHTSYGGGILLAPFNLLSVAVTYGVSEEIKMLQFRLGVLF